MLPLMACRCIMKYAAMADHRLPEITAQLIDAFLRNNLL